jgi:hypothetical protein
LRSATLGEVNGGKLQSWSRSAKRHHNGSIACTDVVRAPQGTRAFLAMGCSWLAVQNPHDILSGGDCSDREREGKSQLFESGHAGTVARQGG